MFTGLVETTGVILARKMNGDAGKIIIDPKRCPETAREFSSYEYESDGRGGWRAAFPDRDNHAIDAVRYSREEDMRHIRVR